MGVSTKCLVYLCGVLTMTLFCAESLSINSQVSLLMEMKGNLSGSSDALSSWNVTYPLCQWRGVLWGYNGIALNCSVPRTMRSMFLVFNPRVYVIGIDLQGAGLQGTISAQLGSLVGLQTINLNNNSLSGHIPSELGDSTRITSVAMKNNRLNGSIPWKLCGNLVELVLGFNELSGGIIQEGFDSISCPLLSVLELNNNKLSGEIPRLDEECKALQRIDLSHNSFYGDIPEGLTKLQNLTSLNLAHNNLTGQIPKFAQSFGASAFARNDHLCGYPLLRLCPNVSTSAGLNSSQVSVMGSHSHAMPAHSTGAIAGLIIGSLTAIVIMCSVMIHCYDKSSSNTTCDVALCDPLSTAKNCEFGGGKLMAFQGGEGLTAEEVLNAPGEVLGKSASGTVYKARLSDGSIIALRLLRDGSLKGSEKLVPAILELGAIRHRNLVPLRGFYSGTKGENLLAYDFLPRESLAEVLHSINRAPPGWARRHKIVLGAARALAYLHTNTTVIHGNIKSKNILLDDNYDAHLADFGLHTLMTSGANAQILESAASQGYKAPELEKMKRANTKTDVYSFGIVLLEILTGRRPGKTKSPNHIVDLPSEVKDAVLEERVSELFDLELLRGMRNPTEEGLLQVLQLAMGCCAPSPQVRPHMKEVVQKLEEIKPKPPSPLYALSPQYNSDDKSSIDTML